MRYGRIFTKIEIALLLLAILITGGCASLPDNADRTSSLAITETGRTRLGKAYRAAEKAHPGKSGFYLLTNGLDALVAREVLCELAERGLDLQYFIYDTDNTGKYLYSQILAAADRGVRVRILLDDLNTVGNNHIMAALDSHPNIEMRVFNPFNRDQPRALQYVTRFGSITKRMHNKVFIVDNQAAIVGGRNIGDKYFGADPDASFMDNDVLGIGPVVDSVSNSFDIFWNSELSYPVASLSETKPPEGSLDQIRKELDEFVRTGLNPEIPAATRESQLAQQLRANTVPFEWGSAEAFYDQPAKVEAPPDSRHFYLTPHLRPSFDQLKSELIIVSPYFVPGDDGVSFLADLVKRGVKVRVLTNSLASTDVLAAFAGYSKFRPKLLQAGVELYEVNSRVTRDEREDREERERHFDSSGASLHAKTLVFDREKIFIGSMNFDLRSFYLNTEIGILFHSSALAERFAEHFEQKTVPRAFRLELIKDKTGKPTIQWVLNQDGRVEIFNAEPYSNLLPQIQKDLLSVLPIESSFERNPNAFAGRCLPDKTGSGAPVANRFGFNFPWESVSSKNPGVG